MQTYHCVYTIFTRGIQIQSGIQTFCSHLPARLYVLQTKSLAITLGAKFMVLCPIHHPNMSAASQQKAFQIEQNEKL